MKRTRIVALVSTLCICLALFATGVWALASTVPFSLNGNLKYYPEGVYVELSGQVYRGDSLDTLEPITSDSRFTLEKQTNFDNTDGEPSGNFPMSSWDIGSLPFAPQLRFIKIEVNVTNYSDFDIQGTAQNTIDGTNLEITDNVYNLACIEPKETITYELLLELTGTTEIEKTIEVNFDFEKFVAQDESQYSTLTFTSNGDGTAEVSGKSPTGDLLIPRKVSIGGAIHSVTSIANSAFFACRSLTSITIPSSVTSIGSQAFWVCSSLTSIEIPSSVTSIGVSTFQLCSGLTSIEIPSSVTSIGESAFSDTGLTSIEIPSSVTSIGYSAFSDCTSLTSITFGENSKLESIGERAFRNCSSLTSINLPSSVTSIGDSAFWDCSGLTSVTIQNGVTSIGRYAFSDCGGLTSITFGENSKLASIGDYAFSSCTSLTSIEIPSSVTSIGFYAFSDCGGLTSITFGENSKLASIGFDAFYGCSGLKYIHLSGNLTSAYSLSGTWQYSATELTTPTFSTTTSSMQSAGWYYQQSAWNA